MECPFGIRLVYSHLWVEAELFQLRISKHLDGFPPKKAVALFPFFAHLSGGVYKTANRFFSFVRPV